MEFSRHLVINATEIYLSCPTKFISKPKQSNYNVNNVSTHTPFSEKITELLARIQTVLHIVIQNIKPIVFLPL